MPISVSGSNSGEGVVQFKEFADEITAGVDKERPHISKTQSKCSPDPVNMFVICTFTFVMEERKRQMNFNVNL